MSFRHAGLTCFLAFFSSQLNDRSLSFSVMVRITRQGFPPAMTLDGISFVTTLPAAMILDRKSTRLNSSHDRQSRMPSSA